MACVGGVYYPHFLCTQRTMRLDAMPSATASPLGVFYPSPGEGRERAPANFSVVFVVMAGGPLALSFLKPSGRGSSLGIYKPLHEMRGTTPPASFGATCVGKKMRRVSYTALLECIQHFRKLCVLEHITEHEHINYVF